MRAITVAMALMLVAGAAQAQSRAPSQPNQGQGYGPGVGGTSGYGYSTGSNPSGHYGGGYIRSDGTFAPPQGSANPGGTQTDSDGTRGSNASTGARKPRY